MTFLMLVLRTLGPFITTLGVLGFFSIAVYSEFSAPMVWTISAITGVLGIILGASHWGVDVPPRWFWSKSKSELLETRIGAAFNYGLICFNVPLAVYFVTFLIDYMKVN